MWATGVHRTCRWAYEIKEDKYPPGRYYRSCPSPGLTKITDSRLALIVIHAVVMTGAVVMGTSAVLYQTKALGDGFDLGFIIAAGVGLCVLVPTPRPPLAPRAPCAPRCGCCARGVLPWATSPAGVACAACRYAACHHVAAVPLCRCVAVAAVAAVRHALGTSCADALPGRCGVAPLRCAVPCTLKIHDVGPAPCAALRPPPRRLEHTTDRHLYDLPLGLGRVS